MERPSASNCLYVINRHVMAGEMSNVAVRAIVPGETPDFDVVRLTDHSDIVAQAYYVVT